MTRVSFILGRTSWTITLTAPADTFLQVAMPLKTYSMRWRCPGFNRRSASYALLSTRYESFCTDVSALLINSSWRAIRKIWSSSRGGRYGMRMIMISSIWEIVSPLDCPVEIVLCSMCFTTIYVLVSVHSNFKNSGKNIIDRNCIPEHKPVKISTRNPEIIEIYSN